MTTPTDAVGLSERLRKTLACVEPDDFRGDNLAIFIASELEPSIEDETLDDSMTWKQGALDACDRVLDAIHAHYATAIDALQARVKELEQERNVQILRALRAEQERDKLQGMLLLCGELGGIGKDETPVAYLRRLIDGLIDVGRERDEAYERLKPFAVASDSLDDKHSDRSDIWESPSAIEITAKHLRAARDLVRRLAGPEKEGE